jgi:hypothetical protein
MPGEPHFSDFNEDCSDQLATIVDRLERWFLSFQVFWHFEGSGVMLERSQTFAIASAQDKHHA